MLEGLRTASQNWFGRLVLSVVMGFIILSFAIWGVNDMFRGYGSSRLATVGGTQISVDSYRSTYQQELQRLQRQLQRPITSEQARQFGLDSRVLSKLVTDAALDQRAQSFGLSLSDDEIAKTILGDPSFLGPSGKFDKDRFDSLMRDAGLTERGFVHEQRGVYLRQQLTEAVAGRMAAPSAMLDAFHRYGSETRSIDYMVLTAAAAGDIAAADEATLQKFFDDRKHAFRAPEYRKLVTLTVTPASAAKPDSVSDADAQRRYDQVKASRFGTPERRTLRQMVFATDDGAQAAAARIKAGASFDAIAAERGLTAADLDLGTKTKADVFDKQLADIAFSIAEGAVSEPVKVAFGPTLVQAQKVFPETVTPFGEVAADLKREIATERARDSVQTIHDAIEDQRASGKPLAEAAKTAGLEVRTIEAIDPAGRDKAGQPVADLAEREALLRAAFASEIGADNETVQTKDRGYVWFEVAKIEPARDRTLDEVRAEVDKAWHAEEVSKRLATKAADLVKKLDSGAQLADIAAAEGNLDVKHLATAKRSGAEGLPAGVVAQVFNVSVGAAGSGSDGETRLVFRVLDSVVPPLDPSAADAKQVEETLKGALAEDVLTQYVAQLEKDLGVTINNQVLRQATGGGADQN